MTESETGNEQIIERFTQLQERIVALGDMDTQRFQQTVIALLSDLVELIKLTSAQNRTDQAAIAGGVQVIGESLKKIMVSLGSKKGPGSDSTRH